MSYKHIRFSCIGVVMLLSVFYKPMLFAGGANENSVTIIYNNIPGDTTVGVEIGGGFSAFIVFDRMNILFDVGGDAKVLTANMRALGLDSKVLDAVVISHNHWDHIYGLPGIYYITKIAPKVYVPGYSKESIKQQNPRLDIVPVYEPVELFPRVWSTGEIKTIYMDITLHEQALVLNDDDGLCVITGCAHPGIVEMIERVKEILPDKPIALVAGGFHLVNASEKHVRDISTRVKELGVVTIAPSHCTGNLAMEILREEWGERYLELCLGHVHKF